MHASVLRVPCHGVTNEEVRVHAPGRSTALRARPPRLTRHTHVCAALCVQTGATLDCVPRAPVRAAGGHCCLRAAGVRVGLNQTRGESIAPPRGVAWMRRVAAPRAPSRRSTHRSTDAPSTCLAVRAAPASQGRRFDPQQPRRSRAPVALADRYGSGHAARAQAPPPNLCCPRKRSDQRGRDRAEF